MSTLNEIQFQIINSLVFAEPFDTLAEEVDATEPVIAAELKTLIDKRFVQVLEDVEGSLRKSFYYDSDNMRAFQYQATSRGLDGLNK